MKTWGDLSWREKINIEKGNVNPYKYLYGYSFEVKQKVKEGQNKKEKNE